MMSEIPERKARLYAISLSLMVGSMVMAVKFYAYWLTDSSALLSDALESIINVVASAFALWSILFSGRPPDHTHPGIETFCWQSLSCSLPVEDLLFRNLSIDSNGIAGITSKLPR